MNTENQSEKILCEAIESRQQELIALTQDIIRIPTTNPPGDCYPQICEYLAVRLRKSNFSIQMIRATVAIGDSDWYPRWKVLARREGRFSGECVHFEFSHRCGGNRS